MWNKDKSDPERTGTALKTSFFAKGFKMTGDLESVNDIRIEGVIHGNISTTKKIIVGVTGQVIGNIKATYLHVMGEVIGDVLISELVKIDSTGSINGNMQSKNFQIEAGASVEANLRKITPESLSEMMKVNRLYSLNDMGQYANAGTISEMNLNLS